MQYEECRNLPRLCLDFRSGTGKMALTMHDCKVLDAQWATTDLSHRFTPGEPGVLYMDANSIGPMPLDAPARMQQILQQGWAMARRRSWSELDWLDQPHSLAARVAHLIGAEPADVMITDNTSVNQYKLLRYALSVQKPRRVVVMERDVFPSNRYVAQGLQSAGLVDLRLVDDMTQLDAALAPDDVAVVSLSHVDYRSSVRLDMATINARVHARGALSLWDLSHSAGAVAIDLRGSDSDLAVSCGYKYLCGGPGAPSLVYVHPRWADGAWPAVCGWMGHADTFAFDQDYRPGAGPSRFLVGTPPVLANAAFSTAAEIWREVDPQAMDARHRSLTDTLIHLLDTQCAGLGVMVESPRVHAQRGGHVAIRCVDAPASAVAQALVASKVIVSARKPDSLRFGVHPLTTTHTQLWQVVQALAQVLQSASWRDPRFSGPTI
ncbi:MAG: aminotransferase class V-fold PLP-dependent enzyme [Rhodoferax sp.]|nr:aminotransferase class V-fold PLP-dependent enzyme [Rhodoferax sp.]